MGFLGKAATAMGSLAAPVVGGAFGLGGALLQNRAQNKALEAEERARAEALGFQREQAGMAQEAYKARMMERVAMRNALLKRYGLEVPGLDTPQEQPGAVPRGAAQGFGGGLGGAIPQGYAGGGGGVPRGAGMTLQELAMRGKPVGLE